MFATAYRVVNGPACHILFTMDSFEIHVNMVGLAVKRLCKLLLEAVANLDLATMRMCYLGSRCG